ncbi:NLR family CARD domain-containing protein 4-like [Ptychodera flava]|uniref:NLR family CARD domain-containing protein 4-like n=1 Tax=Ptychodera flava TaxID=63121 RepID=UPI00396A5A44
MHSSQSSASSLPFQSSHENDERNQEAEDCLEDVASKCKDILLNIYRKVLSHVQPLSWWKNSLQLDDIYTELELETQKGSRHFERNELFVENTDCHNPRRVLLEGDPGYGKSTFCMKLAYDWARETVENFRDYKLLFLLNLRQCQGNLEDFIFETLLPKDCQIAKGRLMEFIRRNQDKVVLLLDGWDEMVGSANEEIGKLLEGRMLRYCKILLTSRKVHDNDQNERANNLRKRRVHFDRLLSIRGFSLHSLAEFIHRHFLATNQTLRDAGKLIREIDMSQSKQTIRSLMVCPMNALLMCDVWREFGSLLTKTTPLYGKILQLIVKRYHEKSDQEREITNEDIDRQFVFLGKLAVGFFLGEKIKFDKSELQLEENKDILRMGFLTRYFDSRLLSSDPTASFVIHHKTFQEFFAAKYIASLSETEPDKVMDIAKALSVKMIKNDCLSLFKFLAGNLNQKSNLIFNRFHDNDLAFISECLMETDVTENLITSAVNSINQKLPISASLNAEHRHMKDICQRLVSVLHVNPDWLSLSLLIEKSECLAKFKPLLQLASSKEIPLDLCIEFKKTNFSVEKDNTHKPTWFPHNKESADKPLLAVNKDDRSLEIDCILGLKDIDCMFKVINECGVDKLMRTVTIRRCFIEAPALQSYVDNCKKLKSLIETTIHAYDTCLPEFVKVFVQYKIERKIGVTVAFDFSKNYGVRLSVSYDPSPYLDSTYQLTFSGDDITPYKISLAQLINHSDLLMHVKLYKCNMAQCEYIEFCKNVKNSKLLNLRIAYPIGDKDDCLTLCQFEEFVNIICDMKHLLRLGIQGWRFPDIDGHFKRWEAAWKKLYTKLESLFLSTCLPSDRSTLDVEPHPMIRGLCLAKSESNRLKKVVLSGNFLNNGDVSELGKVGLIYDNIDNDLVVDFLHCKVSTVSSRLLKGHFSKPFIEIID